MFLFSILWAEFLFIFLKNILKPRIVIKLNLPYINMLGNKLFQKRADNNELFWNECGQHFLNILKNDEHRKNMEIYSNKLYLKIFWDFNFFSTYCKNFSNWNLLCQWTENFILNHNIHKVKKKVCVNKKHK